ncbi:MAG: PEP-CTERM sorting domain-containing protein [Aquincola sp.]|uniref:PEP-CTERM sorting domain-containing protein n=1 Tax=uncultured Aquincola sp. TaxID=886556 RepID=UPI0032B26B0C|nr:PEP-CTERM sorting domain-containing protein [Aquincola sp.]|tara:strand:- start:1485 stop:2114 length:630 start_codon:yes stop_codon:yes gene_type:complete
MKQSHFRLAGLAAAALLATSAAHADTLSVNNYATTADGRLATGSVAILSGGTSDPVLFNVLNKTTGTSFLAYCIEQSQTVRRSDQTYSAAAYSAPAGVQELYDRFYSTSLQTQRGAVAFQLALWDLTGNTSLSSYSSSDANVALATTWLNTVNADNNPFAQQYTLTRWSSSSLQDVVQAAPVPEPETYALMLAGLGAIGLIARRRQEPR